MLSAQLNYVIAWLLGIEQTVTKLPLQSEIPPATEVQEPSGESPGSQCLRLGASPVSRVIVAPFGLNVNYSLSFRHLPFHLTHSENSIHCIIFITVSKGVGYC